LYGQWLTRAKARGVADFDAEATDFEGGDGHREQLIERNLDAGYGQSVRGVLEHYSREYAIALGGERDGAPALSWHPDRDVATHRNELRSHARSVA
jgi:hypothetical protein